MSESLYATYGDLFVTETGIRWRADYLKRCGMFMMNIMGVRYGTRGYLF